jgi:hypothetical protein
MLVMADGEGVVAVDALMVCTGINAVHRNWPCDCRLRADAVFVGITPGRA